MKGKWIPSPFPKVGWMGLSLDCNGYYDEASHPPDVKHPAETTVPVGIYAHLGP